MGVNIKQLITTKEIDLGYLKGRMIGIDAFNWIYQFLSIIRDRETGEASHHVASATIGSTRAALRAGM